MTTPMRERLVAALAKPLAEANCISVDDFDPWSDVIEGIYGSYSSVSDDLMVGAMEAVRDRRTFDFIKERGFAGELMLYVLVDGHEWEYMDDQAADCVTAMIRAVRAQR
jgi:hypothetical protein